MRNNNSTIKVLSDFIRGTYFTIYGYYSTVTGGKSTLQICTLQIIRLGLNKWHKLRIESGYFPLWKHNNKDFRKIVDVCVFH